MMKAYTDIKQSKKLAEILPTDSADAYYTVIDQGLFLEVKQGIEPSKEDIPCWSLAALIDNIPQIKLDSISQFNRKHWRCCSYFSSDWHSSEWYDNPVDACYEMIVRLHLNKEDKQ